MALLNLFEWLFLTAKNTPTPLYPPSKSELHWENILSFFFFFFPPPGVRQQWQSASDSISLERKGKIIPSGTSNSSANYHNTDLPASVMRLFVFSSQVAWVESISGRAETLIMFPSCDFTQSIIFQLNLLVSARMNHWKMYLHNLRDCLLKCHSVPESHCH